MEDYFGDCTFGHGAEVFGMGAFHVALPERARGPVLVEEEVGRVLLVLVKVVVEAAFFGLGGLDEFDEFPFYEVGLIRVGVDMGDDGEMRHDLKGELVPTLRGGGGGF